MREERCDFCVDAGADFDWCRVCGRGMPVDESERGARLLRARAMLAENEHTRSLYERKAEQIDRMLDEREAMTNEKLTEARVRELEAEVQVLLRAVRHYADEQSWLGTCEYRVFPGFHANAVAKMALKELGLIGGQVAA